MTCARRSVAGPFLAALVLAFGAAPAAAQTGSLSGTLVLDGLSQPYPSIRVQARDPYVGDAYWPGAVAEAFSSTADGTFSITGLQPGSYRVYFEPNGSDRAFQWFPNEIAASRAQLVTVAGGIDTALGAITLRAGYSIGGQVTLAPPPADPPGTFPQIGIDVHEASTGERVSSGPLGTTGSYSRANLPAGRYILQAWPGSTGYIHEVWPDSLFWSGATAIELSASLPTATADFTLAEGRTISGLVTLDGSALQGASVNAFLQGPCCFDIWTGTDGDGLYALEGLPPGTYRLRVQGGTSPGNQPYAGERWNEKSSFDPGDDLTLGGSDIGGINFTLSAARTIQGLVYLDTHNFGVKDGDEPGLQGVGITLRRASDDACCEWGSTDGAGAYRLAVAPGDYIVEANPPSGSLVREYWQEAAFREDADAVNVTALADTTGIDLSLRDGASIGAGLEGRIVGSDGSTGIPGVDVRVERWSTGSWVAQGRSGPDGSFRFANLPAEDYRVYFDTASSNGVNDQDYLSEYWTRCQDETCPEGVIDPADRKVAYPARTILGDFQLRAGGSISGTVCVGDEGAACATNDPGLPASLWVNVESVVSAGPGGQNIPRAQVGLDGRYRIRGLPAPASYRVRVDTWGTDFTAAYYLSAGASTPFTSLATPVQVEIGAAVGEPPDGPIDLHLTTGGSISGGVWCGAGTTEPIVGMPVNANLINAPGLWYGAGATTAADGSYTIRGLPEGDYSVKTDNRGQAASTGCPNPANQTHPSTVPVVGVGNQPGFDFHLSPGASISGNVQYLVGVTSQPVVNMRVSATDWLTGEYVTDGNTAASGDYTLYGLAQGRDYRVQVNTRDGHLDPQLWNFIQEAWDNDYNTGRGAAVASGTANVDFVLELGGAISGRVTAAGGIPLTGVGVSASDMDGQGFWNYAQTDQNGFYVIRGLPAARYSVAANAQPRNYVAEYYDDVVDGSLATPVVVTTDPGSVEVTGNIDFELAAGATIKGRVWASGSPVIGLRMVVNQNQPPWGWVEDFTDANGEYAVSGLGTGTWRVTAVSIGTSHGLERQDVAVSGAGLPCVAGDRSDCVDFDLEQGTSLRVRAFEDDGDLTYETGEGRPGVSVRMRDVATGQDVSPDGWLGVTDAFGYLEITGLPTGSFRVSTGGQSGYVGMYYDNALRFQDADALTLSNPGDSADAFFRLVPGRTISGRVFYDADGDGLQGTGEAGLEDVCLNARSVDGSFSYGACTGPDGDYAITGVLPVFPVPGGTPVQYRVWASAQGTPYASEYYRRVPAGTGPTVGSFKRSEGEIVTVDSGDRTGVDLSFVLGGGVRGTVTEDPSGAFLAGIQINVNPVGGDADGYGVQTDTAGRYLVTGLPPGSYNVNATDRSGVHVAEYFDDTIFSNAATPLAVAARTTQGDPLASTADFDLGIGGAIEGVVYEDKNGDGAFNGSDVLLQGVNVSVEQLASPNSFIGSVNTRTDGSYTLGGLPAGLALRVRVGTPSGTDLIGVYYDGAPNGDQGTVNGTQAASVTVPSPGSTVPDVRFALVAGGSISGLVTDDGGVPALLPGVQVCAEPVATAGGGGCASTGADGAYRIRGLLAGSYRLRAGNNSVYRMEYYDDTTNVNAATLVPVTSGNETPGKSFALSAGGAISGDVVDGSNLWIPGQSVCANPLTAGLLGACGTTDSVGHYVVRGLASGSFRLTAGGGSSPYRFEVYDNQTDNNAATPVAVTSGSETTGNSFVLVKLPQILAGPTPASGVRGTTVPVQVTVDRAAGDACGSYPCVSASFGSSRLTVQNASLSAGLLSFDVVIAADAPLGKHALSVVNDYALEDAAAVKTKAFEVLPQAGGPVPTTGDRVYVAEAGTSRLRAYSSVDYSEADAVPDDPATAIELCCQPQDVVLSADRQLAYVLGGDRALSVVDLRLGREVGRIATDTNSGFGAVAVTATHVYLADRRLNDRVLVFDAATGAKVTDVILGVGALPFGLRLHPGGRYLYVAVRGSTGFAAPSVMVIDTTTQTVASTLPVPAGVTPRGFAFKPDGSRAYMKAAPGTYLLDTTTPASPSLIGTSFVLDTRGDGGQGVIEVASAPGGKVLAYMPANGRLWVADVTTDAPIVIANLTLGVTVNRLKPSSDGTKLFVSHGGSQDVWVVDVTELLASPASVPAARVAGLVVPTALAVGPIPDAPPASRPAVTGVSPSPVANGGGPIAVTVTGGNFSTSPTPIVWLMGSMVRGTVTAAAPASLDVSFPSTTPTGSHVVVVTNPATMESGLDPAVVLQVDPPAFTHTQAVFNSSFGTAGIDVFESDGSWDFIATEPLPAAMAITPDGRLGLVTHTYRAPLSFGGEIVAQDNDVALFELDPDAPPASFRKVVATIPYVFGGFEPPAFTPDVDSPNGVFGYVSQSGYFADTVSVIDPATRSELDVDANPATQSYPAGDQFLGPYGAKLTGISRIELDTAVTDGTHGPNGVALTPDGNLLYVADLGYPGDPSFPMVPGQVQVVNTVTRQVIGTLTKAGNGALTDAQSIVIPPSGDHVFVIGLDGATPPAPALFVYETGETDNDAAFVDRIPLDEVTRGLAVSEDGRTVYVALRFSGVLQAIDVTPKPGGGVEGTKHDIPIGGAPSSPGIAFLAMAYDDGLLYVENLFRAEVHVFDVSVDPLDPVLVTTLGVRCAGSLALQPATGNPRLDSVTPPTGPALGGNTVVLMGANFSAASQVRFGATPAGAVLVESAFRIRATAPAGTGSVAVTVENPGGASATLPLAYSYVADTTPPVFTTPLYVASEALAGPSGSQTVTVSLRWTTDEEAATRLDYGTPTLSSFATVPGFRTSHTVELTGLTPGATYVFQATSTDLSGIAGSDPASPLSRQLISIPDTSAPVITNVNQSVTETTATIVWDTNEAATSLVQFDGTVNDVLDDQQALTGTRQNHSITLTNLQPKRTYEFRVRSSDASGNGPTTMLASPPYQTFTTACESVAPVISGLAVSYLSDDLVILAWTTNELATSFVNYGTSSLDEQGVIDVSLVTDHVVFLTNLRSGQCYGFQAGSTDACGNTDASGDPFGAGNPCPSGLSAAALQATTSQRLAQPLRLGVATLAPGTTLTLGPAVAGFTTPVAADIAGPVSTAVTVTPLGPDRAQISLGTDEAASLLVRYGVLGVGEASAFDPTFTQTPSLILAGLQANTDYLLQIVVTDPKGNATTVPGPSFHTPALPDETAPGLTLGPVTGLTQTSALVSWTTDETAEGWVRFGPQGSGYSGGTASAPGLAISHALPLGGLAPGTLYEFEAGSRDGSGNVGTATGSFQTRYAAPLIHSLTPDRAAQGASLDVVINGSRFDASAQVALGAGIAVDGVDVNAAGTQIVARVSVSGDGSAAVGLRQLEVANPASGGLSATSPFTVVDDNIPVIAITAPASGAELVTQSVTVRGTVSEHAGVTLNGESVPLSGLAFEKEVTLPGPGAHRINVTAEDASGNRSSTSIDVKYMTLSVSDSAVAEGDAGSPTALFELVLPTPSAQDVTVSYSTAGGTATQGTDFVGATLSTATIPAGFLSYPVAVAVSGDLVDEDDETFTLTLSSPSGAALVDSQATGTIRDDDGLPAVTIDDATVTEGNTGTIGATLTLTLSHPSSRIVTVSYTTGGGTATSGTDYTSAGGSLSFAPLTTTQPLTLQVKGDLADEPDETLFVTLGPAMNATLGDSQGQVTILDDDVGASLFVNDVSVVEGNSGTKNAVFTVSLSSPAAVKVKVRYATQHVTTTNQDLDPTSGQLVFQPGQTSKTVTVPIKGDRLDEPNETYLLVLSSPEGAPIADAEGLGTILDNDP